MGNEGSSPPPDPPINGFLLDFYKFKGFTIDYLFCPLEVRGLKMLILWSIIFMEILSKRLLSAPPPIW